MSTGYSISIKALDEASAQIKRINQALKDLEKADNSASDAQANRLRQTKSLTDKLHAGTVEFGKIARSELEKLSKEFGKVSGGIGNTIGELGKAFGLRGLGVAAGIAGAGLAAYELNKGLNEVAKTARELGNLSARTGVDPQQIQKLTALNKLLGVSAEQTADEIRSMSEALREAYKHGGPIASFLAEHGISLREDPAKALIRVKEILSEMAPGQKRTEVAQAFHIPEEELSGLYRFKDALKEVNKSFHDISAGTTKTFDDLKTSSEKLDVAWQSLKNTFVDVFGPGPAAALKTINEYIVSITQGVQKLLEMFNTKTLHEWANDLDTAITGKQHPKVFTAPIPPAPIAGATGAAGAANGAGAGGGGGAASNAPGATGTAAKGASDVKLSTGKDEAVIRDTIRQAGEKAGLNPEEIRMAQAGFLSNFAFESNLRHDITRKGGTDTGWAQWVGPRLRHMKTYGDPHSLEANQKQLYYELTGPYKNALIRAAKAKTPREAATVAHYFESGGAPQFEGSVKQGHIAQADNFYRNSVAPPTRTAPHRSVLPPWVKFNSKGQPYSSELETMSDKEKANVEASMKAIKNNPHWSDLPKKSKPIMGEEGKNKAAAVDKQAADSHHSVEIAFNNLPQGARVNLHESKGSSALNVKTSYAMGTV